jgi:hypothetical protein
MPPVSGSRLRLPGPPRAGRAISGSPAATGAADRLTFVVTYDRDLVLAAAGPLLDRLPAAEQRPW